VALAGGATVEAVEAGDGPPLVLIPGLSGDKEVFRHQVSGLSERHRVITADLRLSFDGVARDFDQFAHDVARVMDHLEVRSAAVLGLSFGGPIAMRFASLYPDRVEALIVTNTLSRLDLDHVGLNRTLLIPVALATTRWLPDAMGRRLADVWGRLGVWLFEPSPGNERVIDYYLSSPIRNPVSDGTRRMDTFRDRDLRGDLPGIHQPALVIHGAADGYCLPEWQREIAELLANATYVEIPAAGHLALISHPETFNGVVAEWLAELGAGRAGSPGATPSESR
jgi:3-oxoadipate enol-lactonase